MLYMCIECLCSALCMYHVSSQGVDRRMLSVHFILPLLVWPPWVHVRLFSRLNALAKCQDAHAEQTQAHRQPQHLDHGNETAQHLESAITPSMRFHFCMLLIKQLHCEFAVTSLVCMYVTMKLS